MNTNMTGFKRFSKTLSVLVLLMKVASALKGLTNIARLLLAAVSINELIVDTLYTLCL